MGRNISSQKGFTLVELAISIIVMAFAVAAVMGAQTLIQQAKIRSVIQEVSDIKSAIETFRGKYDAWPGDFDMAESVWGAATTNNGDGDGIIEGEYLCASNPESLLVWQHLTLANMIMGNYTGLSTGSAPNCMPNVNVPASEIEPNYYYVWTHIYLGVIRDWFDRNGNHIHYGRTDSGNSAMGPSFSPVDAANFDDKIDDGVSYTGEVYGVDANGHGGKCSGAYTAAPTSAVAYKKTLDELGCRMIIWLEPNIL